MYRNDRQRGVTLIELMMVVIIVSILASVAIPSYRSYIIRTQRSDAKSALLQLRAAQEKYYLQNNAYTANVTGAPPAGLGLPANSANGFYSLRVALGTAASPNPANTQAYVAYAEPVEGRGQQDDTKCLTLTLTDVGLRGASGPGGTDYCWR